LSGSSGFEEGSREAKIGCFFIMMAFPNMKEFGSETMPSWCFSREVEAQIEDSVLETCAYENPLFWKTI